MIAADTSTWVARRRQGCTATRSGTGRPAGCYDPRCAHRAAKRPKGLYRRCRNALGSAFDRDRIWLLATSGSVASEGAGEAPQGTPRRRSDCPKLHRRRRSSPHARPGLSSVRRSCAPRSCTWVVNGLTGSRPVTGSQHVGIVECFRRSGIILPGDLYHIHDNRESRACPASITAAPSW